MLQKVLCLLSAATILVAQQPAPTSRPADLLLGKARALEARGRIDLAAQAWQQLLMIDPDQQDAIAGLARAAKMAGRESEAAVYLEKLRKLNAKNPAIKQIEAVGRPDRRNPDLEEAAKFASAGQPEKAVAAYQRAFGGDIPSGEMTVAYYETLAATPEGWQAATAGLEQAVQKNPAAQDYKLSLGRLYTYRPPTRMKGLSILQSLNGPYSMQAQQAWRQALVWEKGSARSAESLRAYLSRYPDSELQAMPVQPQSAMGPAGGVELRRAYQALKSDDLVAAAKLFEEAIKKDAKDAGAHAGLGFVRMKEQNFADAQRRFETALPIAPENRVYRDALTESRFWVAMQAGDAALKENRANDAVSEFDKARNLRPKSVDALHGYAGALMQRGDYAAALPVLERVTKMDATRARGWADLVRAKEAVAGAEQAVEILKKAPPAVTAKLNSDLEYLSSLAALYQRAGDVITAKKIFERANALARKTPGELSAPVETQLGGLNLQFGNVASAVRHYKTAVENNPENLDAWEGFLLASNQAGEAGPALKMLETLPVSVHETAQQRPGFLRAVAAVETSVGSLASADSLLTQARQIETASGKDLSFATALQTAQVWLEQEKAVEAGKIFTLLRASHPEDPAVWKGVVLSLYKQGAYQQAAEAMRSVPAQLDGALVADAGYIGVVAAVYKETGSAEEALRFLRDAAARYAADGRPTPPALTVQLGWMLLDSPNRERELFVLLRNTRSRTDLPAKERRAIDELWVTWMLRSSEAAKTQGNMQEAISILEAGVRMMPSDARLRRSLAGVYLSNSDPKRAFAVYKATGFVGATAADYVAAVGAGIAAHETRAAETWLKEGVAKYPSDTELLSVAGKQAAAKGDFKKAEGFWRVALQGLDSQAQEKVAETLRSGPDGIKNLKPGDPTDDLGTVLLSRSQSSSTVDPAVTRIEYRLPWASQKSSGVQPVKSADVSGSISEKKESEAVRNTEALVAQLLASQPETRGIAPASGNQEQAVLTSSLAAVAPKKVVTVAPTTKESLNRMLDALQTPDSRSDLKTSLQPAPAAPDTKPIPDTGRVEDVLTTDSNTSLAALLTPIAPASSSNEREKIVDQIKTVESRNSPYLGLGGRVLSRSGQSGFEKMMLQETTLESSIVASRRVRASVLAKSIFADATGPDGQSLYRFGLLPQGDTFAAPSVSGLAGEVQLSGNNFGLRFGSTPRAFPVKNLIGGFRYRPSGGPITLTFERDSVKDTLLSYAGAQDPITKRVWGGVIANAGSLGGNFGDEKSGVYFNLGFQHITGNSVETNRRIDGTLGTYWRLVHTPVGSLNAGLNLFAMHYAKNLRYFTLGQGGYFSPQRFFLFNVPVNWSAKTKRLEYVIAASLGSQSFTEESSPFFPVDPLVQGKTGPYYPKFSSSGVNYNFDTRIAYQIAENWFLVGFLNVNNARSYTQQSAGVSIRYSFRPKPLGTDVPAPSIPDWGGRQPFGLQ